MSGSPTFEGLTQETIEEHRQINFFLDQIAVTLDGLKSGLSDEEPMRRLAAQLEGLRERLVEHHTAEEQHHGNRQNADQEVCEGQAPPHPPQQTAKLEKTCVWVQSKTWVSSSQ